MTSPAAGAPAAPNRWQAAVSSIGSVVAPFTLLSALLFYFGYASSRAQYEYFGLDVDTIGLSTQDFVMRSPQPLLVPLLVLTLAAVAVVAVRLALRQQITGPDPSPRRLLRLRRIATAGRAVGIATTAAGVVLLFCYGPLREWPLFAVVTPSVLAAGAALVIAGLGLRALLDDSPGRGRAAVVALHLVLATSLFWATATLAEFSGRGSAHYQALHLDRLPSVILDTKERLYLTSPGVQETVLPTGEDQEFRYRYRQLQLLIQGEGRLFLVPRTWSASDSTIVVPMDDGVRVQFQFRNDPP
jgi:hypothetical protein